MFQWNMQKRIGAKKPDVRNVRMSEVRNGEGKKEIMGKIREKRDLGSTFLAHLKCFFFFSLPPAYKTWEKLYF